MQQIDIRQTLLEARKAYRFLYEYQKRILDLVNFIGDKFGFSYQGGYPKFSVVTPRYGKGDWTSWAWDWLNMYYYEFNFEGKEETNNNKIYFSIFVLNDTGFFKAKEKNEKNEKADKEYTNTFEDVESSESKLIFVVGKKDWSEKELKGFWQELDFILEEVEEKDFKQEKVFCKSYSLEDFADEKSALVCIENFKTFSNEKGIKLKKVDKESV